MFLACAKRTRGGFIQQAFNAPKQARRPFEGNEIRVEPAHIYQKSKKSKKVRKSPISSLKKAGDYEYSHFLNASNPSAPSTSQNRPVTSRSLRERERAYPSSYSASRSRVRRSPSRSRTRCSISRSRCSARARASPSCPPSVSATAAPAAPTPLTPPGVHSRTRIFVGAHVSPSPSSTSRCSHRPGPLTEAAPLTGDAGARTCATCLRERSRSRSRSRSRMSLPLPPPLPPPQRRSPFALVVLLAALSNANGGCTPVPRAQSAVRAARPQLPVAPVAGAPVVVFVAAVPVVDCDAADAAVTDCN